MSLHEVLQAVLNVPKGSIPRKMLKKKHWSAVYVKLWVKPSLSWHRSTFLRPPCRCWVLIRGQTSHGSRCRSKYERTKFTQKIDSIRPSKRQARLPLLSHFRAFSLLFHIYSYLKTRAFSRRAAFCQRKWWQLCPVTLCYCGLVNSSVQGYHFSGNLEMSGNLANVRKMSGLERLTLVISFVSKGFSPKDQIEELFIVMVYCIYSQHVVLSTFSLITLF